VYKNHETGSEVPATLLLWYPLWTLLLVTLGFHQAQHLPSFLLSAFLAALRWVKMYSPWLWRVNDWWGFKRALPNCHDVAVLAATRFGHASGGITTQLSMTRTASLL
jgi:hypothetical protein